MLPVSQWGAKPININKNLIDNKKIIPIYR